MTQKLSPAAAGPISTPCSGVCTLDAQGLCMGCFRSGAEIAAWITLTEEQRHTIMAQLAARKDAYFV